jgi:hypothetical protein
MSEDFTEQLLVKWAKAKEEKEMLEKKIEKYKRHAEKYMEQNKTDIIVSESFSLQRKQMTKSTITKANVPKEIWNQYSHTSSYPAFYLKKTK